MSECCTTQGNDIFTLNTSARTATFVGAIGGARRVHDVDLFLPQPVFAGGFEYGEVSAWTSFMP